MKYDIEIDKTNWTKVRLCDVAEEISERIDAPSQFERFVGLEHLKSGDIQVKEFGDTTSLVSSMKKFNKSDILFARRNTYLKRASLVEFDGVCSGDAFVIRVNKEKVEGHLLAFLMNSENLWDYANKHSAGSLNGKRVKWKDLANYEFLLPPKEEQSRFAELLWAADEIVERHLEVVEKIDTNRQTLMKNLFQINNHSSLLLSELPIKEINGLWKTEDEVSTTDVKIIRSTEFSKYGAICFDKLEPMRVKTSQYKTRKLLPNDIIIERSGGGPDQPVGRVCFFNESNGEYSFSNFTSCIRVMNEDVIKSKYLFYFLQYFWEMKGTDRMQNQTTGIRNLDYELFKRIRVPMCPLERQMKIISVIEEVQNLINNYDKYILYSQQLKSTLINQI